MIITIDGPAGAGKSTAARRLAKALNIAHMDTGATYRAATLKALHCGVDMENGQQLAEIVKGADVRLICCPDGLKVLLDNQDVSAEIRSQTVTQASYYLARSPAVRSVLVELQRRIGSRLGSFVTEGRDQGSVVFPQADVKFYLDANADVRARRRFQELRSAGQQASYDEVLNDIITRDNNDINRSVGPLVKPPDAIVIDSSHLDIEQTVAEMLKHVGGNLR